MKVYSKDFTVRSGCDLPGVKFPARASHWKHGSAEGKTPLEAKMNLIAKLKEKGIHVI